MRAIRVVGGAQGLELIPDAWHKLCVRIIGAGDQTAGGLREGDSYFVSSTHIAAHGPGLIVGARECLVGGELQIDTPPAWSNRQVYEYVDRVRTTHSTEFQFLKNYNAETGLGEIEEVRPYAHLKGDYVLCGSVESWNFGFFLAVVMQKVFLATRMTPELTPLVPVTHEWQARLLKYVFPNVRIRYFDRRQVLSYDRLHTVSWPGFGFHLSAAYRDHLRSCANNTLLGVPRADKIILSRRRVSGGARKPYIDSAIDQLFSDGFVPIFPERLEPAQVASLLASARVVALDSGSALFNLAFAPSTLKVLLVESRPEFLANHSRFINSCGVNGTVMVVDGSQQSRDSCRMLLKSL